MTDPKEVPVPPRMGDDQPAPEDPMDAPEFKAFLAEQSAAQMQVRQFIAATALGIYSKLVSDLLSSKGTKLTHSDLRDAAFRAYRTAPYLAEAMGTVVVNERETGGPFDNSIDFEDIRNIAETDRQMHGED